MKPKTLSKLSPEAQAARRPFPPWELLNALHGNIEVKPGRSRAVHTIRTLANRRA